MLAEMLVMRIFDGLACALLAAAAACRARNLGANMTGAIILGCLCGLLGPLLRETFTHGQAGSLYIAAQFPGEALIGALAGVAAIYIMRGYPEKIFFWLDTVSLGFAACVGTLLALPIAGVGGALVLGLMNGLAPGLLRDVALGDTAMLMDTNWYASAAALGCMMSIGIIFYVLGSVSNEWATGHAEELAALCGCAVVVLIRWQEKRKKNLP